MVILGKPYKVTSMPLHGSMAVCDRDKQTITIDSESCSNEQVEEALLHEVIHIVDLELVLGLSEETIARLAVGIYSAGYRR